MSKILTRETIDELVPVYRDGLLKDVVPFWTKHATDKEHGGFLFSLDRDGSVVSDDKPMWIHGRFVWLLSELYAEVERNEAWLELARSGLEFMNAHAFDEEGRMHFLTTRDGRPLRQRRYIYTEAFATMAMAAYGRAANDKDVAEEAVELFKLLLKYQNTPGLLEPKVNPETRPTKGLAIPMIVISTAQALRKATDDPIANEWIERSIEESRAFVNDELRCVLETVGANGEFIDTFDGRLLCPGHAIELAWFVLYEAKRKGGDKELLDYGLKILDFSFDRGWDEEYGGVIYYRDAKNLPPTEYWHDMKFWWPQNEAIIANLLAHQLTGDDKYAERFLRAHKWTHERFPDPEYGEWFGYLHRDGRLSTTLKGNHWKGPFHIPRMQLIVWKTLEELR